MRLAAFCIKHKVMTVLAFLMIAIFGVVFYSNLKLSLLPNLEFPAAYIMCTFPGASPEDVEELVVRPLESSVATLTGVKEIQSSSSENVGVVMITYEDGTDVDQAAIKLREKFDLLTLPSGCNDPIIVNINIDDLMPVAVIALSGEDLVQLQTVADDVISPSLERLDGVAQVQVMGGIQQQITVETNPTALSGYGLSLSQVSDYLAAANLLYPGGEVYNGTNTLTATTNGKYRTVEDVANTLLFLPQGGTVRLSEVASVYMESSLEDSAAKVDGENCVVLLVNKRAGTNEVDVSRKISSNLEQVRKENPSIQAEVVYQASEYIEQTVNNALQNIGLGVILSAVVVFVFLRRFGATMTISVSMPFCVLTMFLLMNVFDISMNMMSLGAIALCIGMVVDNSIVVLENIYRYAGDGYTKLESCIQGTGEVINSITASSLTTIAVFLPIGLSGGMTGMLFKDFSLTVTFLILSSLIIALTLVPLLCYFLLDETAVRIGKLKAIQRVSRLDTWKEKLSGGYQRILSFFLHHRLVACIISVVLVAGFLLSCIGTNMVMLPDMDQSMVTVSVKMPTGTELEDTMAYADRVTGIIRDNCPELDSLYYTVGGTLGMGSAESADINIDLVNKSQRTRSSKEVARDLKKVLTNVAGCEITTSASSMMEGMTGSSDFQVNVSGADYNVLTTLTADLTSQIAALSDTTEVDNSLEQSIPAVKIAVNHDLAAQYNLTAATIGAAVRSELTGSTATTVTMDGNDLDVVVKGSGASAASLDALRSLSIATPTGGSVPLSTVADVRVELTPQTISRTDQVRQVQITGNSLSGKTSALAEEIQVLLDGYDFPEGYRAEIGGAYTDMMENFHTLGLAMIVATGLVYFILAVQFESFLMPVMIMLILPFALSGALFGLPLTGMDISMIVLLALVMLIGTVVNSSIVLVDYINIRRGRGQEKLAAILEACPLRIRPILMTTLTTVLALIPMAKGVGEGNEILEPMGVVMITGMVISTIVTLLFTPVYYSMLDSLAEHFGGPIKRRRARKKELLLQELEELEEKLGIEGPDNSSER